MRRAERGDFPSAYAMQIPKSDQQPPRAHWRKAWKGLAGVSPAVQQAVALDKKGVKRKVSIGRFTNETKSGFLRMLGQAGREHSVFQAAGSDAGVGRRALPGTRLRLRRLRQHHPASLKHLHGESPLPPTVSHAAARARIGEACPCRNLSPCSTRGGGRPMQSPCLCRLAAPATV